MGNVLATVSDKKIGVDNNSDGIIDYYNADVITANDYTPFGMQMVRRKYSQANTKYRYGFNGKENDNDVKGEGNQQDYGMRIYDPRLGRFLSVDPLEDEYPELTPYQFAGNTPIQATDLDGEEPSYHYEDGKGRIVMMPAGDNLQRRVPPEHLKYLPYASKGDPGIMDAGTSAVFDNMPFIGTGKAIVEAMVGYDATGNKLGVGESLFALAPFIGKAKKTIKVFKAIDKINDTKKLTKAANKVDDAVSTEKAIVKNKNANDAEGNFGLYDVHEYPEKKGKLLKVGKENLDRVRADGTPDRRAVSQRKARQAGYPNATSSQRKNLGNTTTGKATDIEAIEVKKERANGNELPLNRERSKKYKN